MPADQRPLTRFLLFLPLIIGTVMVFVPQAGKASRGDASEGTVTATATVTVPASAATGAELSPEQLMFLLQYVGSDYPGAVGGGQVLDDFEYQEMLEFSRVLTEAYPREDSPVKEELEELRSLVLEKADPSVVLQKTRDLVVDMTGELRLVTYPSRAPDVAAGARLYETGCAQCHGSRGDGAGPSAPGMEPPPTSFRGERMKGVAPHQLFNAIGFGVGGTTMPSFQEAMSVEDRWNLAFYIMTLRDDFAPAAPSEALSITVRDLATKADEELEQMFGAEASALDYYRREVPETPEDELLRLAERKLDESYRAYEDGRPEEAVRLSLEAYLEGIEPTEATLAASDVRLVRDIERELTGYRASMRDGVPAATLIPRLERLRELTKEAKGVLTGTGSGFGFVLVQSAAILIREGIEAALLVALLMSYLTAAGQPELRRFTLLGAGAGILAGFVTWFVAQYIVGATTLHREALEGITSLLAAAVLFSVSFWIIHNADLKRWKSYIEERTRSALGRGSRVALASVAFLAVYREAFETVLFYQALFLRHEESTVAILGGIVAALAVLAVIIVAMFYYGKRIPLKPFFTVTGVLLGLLSFVFAGYGIAELQKIGWIKETPLPVVPYVPFFELQPTLEGLALQLGILLSFLLAWFVAGNIRRSSAGKHAPA